MKRYLKAKIAGTCVNCHNKNKQAVKGSFRCADCIESRKQYALSYYRKWRKERKNKGLCSYCPAPCLPKKWACANCMQDILDDRAEEHVKLRKTVLTQYGKNGELKCCWPDCNIVDMDMLTLDHINDDGAKERKVVQGSVGTYRKVIRLNFPSGYQTLCHNHQWKKESQRRRDIRKQRKDQRLKIVEKSS